MTGNDPEILHKSVRADEIFPQLGLGDSKTLNPVMIDGTGMCGGCRVEVGGETKFACVDGPHFDAFKVDFDELIQRNRMYGRDEHTSLLTSIKAR